VVPWWYWLVVWLYDRFPGIIEYGMRRSLRPADQVNAEIQRAQGSSR
jgi:hypothetical protein